MNLNDMLADDNIGAAIVAPDAGLGDIKQIDQETVVNPDDIFEESNPGEVPVFEKEIKLIESNVRTLESLNSFLIHMKDKSGMNKVMALECQAIMDDFLTTKMTIRHFSDFTSKTGLGYTQEAINIKSVAIIGALIAAGIALANKVINYFWPTAGMNTSGGSSSSGSSGSSESNKANINTVQSQIEAIEQAIAERDKNSKMVIICDEINGQWMDASNSRSSSELQKAIDAAAPKDIFASLFSTVGGPNNHKRDEIRTAWVNVMNSDELHDTVYGMLDAEPLKYTYKEYMSAESLRTYELAVNELTQLGESIKTLLDQGGPSLIENGPKGDDALLVNALSYRDGVSKRSNEIRDRFVSASEYISKVGDMLDKGLKPSDPPPLGVDILTGGMLSEIQGSWMRSTDHLDQYVKEFLTDTDGKFANGIKELLEQVNNLSKKEFSELKDRLGKINKPWATELAVSLDKATEETASSMSKSLTLTGNVLKVTSKLTQSIILTTSYILAAYADYTLKHVAKSGEVVTMIQPTEKDKEEFVLSDSDKEFLRKKREELESLRDSKTKKKL